MISVVALYNIHFNAKNTVVKLDNKTILTNDLSRITRKLKLWDSIEYYIGKLEYDELVSGCVVALRDEDETEKDINKCLHNILFDIQVLSNAIWVKYDSCVDTEVGFTYEFGSNARIVSTMIKSGFYCSTGLKKEISIGYSELNKIINTYYNKLNSAFELVLGTTIVLNKETERITRCLYHFTRARSLNVQELKIAEYCSGLESVFATSTSELAHILSERIAILLGNSSIDKIEMYKLVKSIYNIRSKVVHGACIDENKIVDLSTKIDDVSRKVICYIFDREEFETLLKNNNSEDIDMFFLNKLLIKTDI